MDVYCEQSLFNDVVVGRLGEGGRGEGLFVCAEVPITQDAVIALVNCVGVFNTVNLFPTCGVCGPSHSHATAPHLGTLAHNGTWPGLCFTR